MRAALLTALTLSVVGVPASAQFTTTYTGIQRDGDKETPAVAQFSVDGGRAVMIMKGIRSARMLFDAKEGVLRMVSDDDKSYFEITKGSAASGDPTGMMAGMQKQLDALPKEQRQMAEQMMKSAMGSASQAPHLVYQWTKETKTIAGYECTLVEGMRGSDKVTEYCGSTSPDLKMTDAERETMLEMQGYLRNFTIGVRGTDDSARAFQWDTSVDGYPVLTRCFTAGKMTLELLLGSVNHHAIPREMFAVPAGYKKMDMSRMSGR
jgi:hypothetical protein